MSASDKGKAHPSNDTGKFVRAMRRYLIVVAVIFVVALLTSRTAWMSRTNDFLFKWLETRGETVLYVFAVAGIFPLFIALLVVLRNRLKKTELFWARFAVLLFGLYGVLQIPVLFLLNRNKVQQFPRYFQAVFRIDVTVIFLAIGIVVYLFKKWNKVIYGCSEVAISIAANFAIVKDVDFSKFPRIHSPRATLIGLLVFTYLLSKGVGSMIEGLEEKNTPPQAAHPGPPQAAARSQAAAT